MMRDFLPEIRQVRAFIEVVDSGNFTKASRNLGVTQSAVSYSIRSLEEGFETKLIERGSKGVSLTQSGVVVLRHFRSVLKECELAAENVKVLNKWSQGRIKVGATRTFCRYFMPSVIDEFRRKFPRCEIHLEAADTEELLEKVDDLTIDFAYGILTSLDRLPHWCRFEKLFEDELVFAVAPDHPWVSLNVVPLDMVSSESLLVYAKSSETHRLFMDMCKREAIKIKTSLVLGDMELIGEMARKGIGVGVTSPWAIKDKVDQGYLVALPMEKPIRREWGLFSAANKEIKGIEKSFMMICEDILKY